jgi:RimJ/RimL family protein N-acetyltransferase
MLITLPGLVVRDWRPDDAPSLFLALVANMQPRTFFTIAVADRAVGGIGYTLHHDVERVAAEIGYWLGAAFWGRGIMTSALSAVTAYAFREHPELRRIYAVPYAWSAASMRVLEKAGYRLEGRMRQSAIKDGQVVDQLLYAIIRVETARP